MLKASDKNRARILFGILLGAVLLLSVFVFAPSGAAQAQDSFGLQPVGQSAGLGGGDIRVTIGKIVRAALGLLGVVAVGITLYGGFIYLTSGGNEEKVAQGKKVLVNGVIGLAIILSALAITQFVLNKLSEATGSGQPRPPSPCVDLTYAWSHPEECPDDVTYPLPCNEKHFVVQSITPRTENTGMNNAAVRVVFSRRIQDIPAGDIGKYITISRDGADFTGQFSFQILGNVAPDKNAAIEARYSGLEICKDGTPCLPSGNYTVKVSPEIKDEKGKSLEKNTSCGVFPVEASFSIKNEFAFESALKFNGKVGSYVEVKDSPSLDIKDKITVSAWVNLNSLQGSGFYQWIAGKITAYNGLSIGQNGMIYFFTSGGDVSHLGRTKALTWETGKWYQVAAVYDNSSKTVKFFRDGAEVEIDAPAADGKPHYPAPTVGIAENDNPLIIGAMNYGGGSHVFNGQIDEVRVYGRLLSSAEISSLYKEGKDNVGDTAKDDLAGGWHFDERNGSILYDFSGNENTGMIAKGENSPVWEVKTDPSKTIKIKDTIKPLATPLTVYSLGAGGQKEPVTDGRLVRGESYFFETAVSDASGAGYAEMSIERQAAISNKIYGYFDGPSIARGSDALREPYLFSHRRYFPENTTPLESYLVAVKTFDIDNNFTIVTTTFTVVPEHCVNGELDEDLGETGVDVGGECGEANGPCDTDANCSYSYRCVKINVDDAEKHCQSYPLIENVDPMEGAAGNWLTIFGRNFGANQGMVEFSSGTAWFPAKVVSCGPSAKKSWADSWAIVEVPAETPVDSLSNIRLTADYLRAENDVSSKPSDETTDNWGPKPGPNAGWFSKNNNERPGLCLVAAAETVYNSNGEPVVNAGATVAPVDAKIAAYGKGFGAVKSDSDLYFSIKSGGPDSPVKIKNNSDWSDEAIFARTPNLAFGKYGVYVLVDKNNQELKSNKVPFEILNLEDLQGPQISNIDPATTTRGSLITIKGDNFGDMTGRIYLSASAGGTDYELNVSLPSFCGDNWQNQQVVAEVPEDFSETGAFYLTLERGDDFLRTSGNDRLGVESGPPLPSLCAISPESGPAPTPPGDVLELFGTNLSKSPDVYFWSERANANDIPNTWLKAESAGVENIKENNKIIGQKITTAVPYEEDEYGGYTMQTGPVKAINNVAVASNGLNYEVSDCRNADQSLTDKMSVQDMRCCDMDGRDRGKWKSKTFACDGETRNAGYVWRFTTGKIPKVPYVVEGCDEANWNNTSMVLDEPSPVPWENWKQGTEACLNAIVAVRFSLPMDPASLTTSTVKLYKCQEDEGKRDCKNAEEVALNDLDGLWLENNVLKIKAPPPDLEPNTWYQVELLEGITSLEDYSELGATTTAREPLKKTRPCDGLNNEKTAYCYDFKTGAGLCTLTAAGINPPDYTTHLLGVLQDKRYPYDALHIFDPLFPYYYYLWGRGNQPCSILNVDGMGWQWHPENGGGDILDADQDKATSVKSPLMSKKDPTKYIYQDTRAKVTAWADGIAEITAATTTVDDGNNIIANSMLTIDLANPKVIDFWPNCEEACVNSGIGVRFNRQMMEDTYENGIRVYKCADELCQTVDYKNLITLNIMADSAEPQFVARANPSSDAFFEKGEWYKVEVASTILSIGAYIKDKDGNITGVKKGKAVEPFSWRFRTKDDGTPCMADKIDVLPSPFAARLIGEKNLYSAVPRGKPDQCNPQGQELNPWWFGWSWESQNTQVADISTFPATKSNKPFCSLTCLYQGADVGRGEEAPPLCGNGILEAGEDCDIAVAGEAPGVSCAYNCLRPNKTKNGTSTTPPGGKMDAEWCGSGTVTKSEECDINLTTSTAVKLGHIEWSQVGCSDKCLHLGTSLSQDWCDKNDSQGKVVECKNAVSICGNGKPESGEECDISDGNICDDKCLLKDACDDTPGLSGFEQCEKGTEGCKDDCTFAGSSLGYPTPSLCGDGVLGAGEYQECDGPGVVSLAANSTIQSPLQVGTAIGLGTADKEYGGKPSQFTDIFAKTTHYIFKDKIADELEYKPLTSAEGGEQEGKGNYYLMCGFTEAASSTASAQYGQNDCPNNPQNEYGVGANSCCYPRSKRISEYPADGAGAVCRNTYLEAEFEQEIDAKSLADNITLAAGYQSAETLADCASTPDKNDVTALVKDSLGLSDGFSLGFWDRVWQGIKRFFARLFGLANANASEFAAGAENYSKWCSGGINLRSAARVKTNPETNTTSTVVSLYIDNALLPNRLYAIVLKGGLKGIKDLRGVGINNLELKQNKMNDVWLFITGKEICKIKEITVDPDSYLFDKPFATADFQAIVASTNGQKIQRTMAYDWRWNWAPAGHPVFDIPLPGTAADTDQAVIGAKNVEGGVLAVAQAVVTEDLSESDNHKGKVFTGTTDLTAMFCERPWPAREGNKWGPFKDYDYNFSMSYCADSGSSGVVSDDLPYFDKKFIYTPPTSGGGRFLPQKACSLSGNECTTDTECQANLYALPSRDDGATITKSPYQGLCQKNSQYILTDDPPTLCDDVLDCAGSALTKMPGIGFNDVKTDGDLAYAVGYINSDPNNVLSGLVIFDVSSPSAPKELSILQLDGVRSVHLRPDWGVAAIAAGSKGVYFVDISDPAKPKILKNYSSASMQALEIVSHNEFFYVANGQYGVAVIRFVKDGGEPQLAAVYNNSECAFPGYVSPPFPFAAGVYWNEGLLYVAGKERGLQVLGLEDPGQPVLSKCLYMGGNSGHNVTDVLVADGRAYVVDAKEGLRIYDVSEFPDGNSKFLSLTKLVNPASSIIAIGKDFLSNHYLYVGDNAGLREILDVSDPLAVKSIFKTYDSIFWAGGLAAENGYVYVAGGNGKPDWNLVIYRLQDLLSLKCDKTLSAFKDKCQSVDIEAMNLTADTLRRYLFLSSATDNAFGAQIFQNPERLSAEAWYNKKFPDSTAKLQKVSIDKNEGVTDGKNYYISALNIKRYFDKEKNIWDYDTFSNIYQLSLNQGAGAEGNKALEQIIGSLKFNINITDHGYCLAASDDPDMPKEKLPVREDLASAISAVPCQTDFECHDPLGNILPGTNGACSVARTKFFRDLSRLTDIKNIQSKLDAHFSAKLGDIDFKGDLKGGTYIPGYTMSKWPSWNNTLGAAVGNLPIEKINTWTNCADTQAEKQTCWNAALSTYSCPAFSQVYEYEYVSSTKSYLLHGPLEFLPENSSLVQDAIDKDKFTTAPKCRSEVGKEWPPWSPYGEKCGDGIIQPNMGEECEPPGKKILGNDGDVPIKPGACQLRPEISCTDSAADCGFYKVNTAPVAGSMKAFSPTVGYCALKQSNAFYAITNEAAKEKGQYQLFGCQIDADCQDYHVYQGDFWVGLHKEDSTFASIGAYANNAFPGQLTANGNEALCKHTGKCAYTKEVCGHSGCDNDYYTLKYRSGDMAVKSSSAGICLAKDRVTEELSLLDPGLLKKTYKDPDEPYRCATESECAEDWGDEAACAFMNNKETFEKTKDIVEKMDNSCDEPVLNVQACQGAVLASQEDKLCPAGNKANWVCSSSCQWDKGLCQTTSQCGNGIVEAGETCDDGVKLNGTYGQCDKGCQGPYKDFCGDGTLNKDAAGHPLEACETVNEQQVIVRDQNDPPLAARLVCSDYIRDWDNSNILTALFGGFVKGCVEFAGHCEYDEKILCGQNIDCGNAPADTARFEMNANNAQDFAASLSPVVGSFGKCIIPPQYGPSYTYNKNKNLSCSWDCQNVGSYCGDKRVDKDFGEECDDGNSINTDQCANTCQINAEPEEEKRPEEPGFCGDGEVDTEEGEVCDTGKENLGKKCQPEYGKSCAYCSSDCKKVLTIDAWDAASGGGFCGNGKIDAIGKDKSGNSVYEVCDQAAGGPIVKHTGGGAQTTAACADKGVFECQADCKLLVNKCVVCSAKQNGAAPKVGLLNPMIGDAFNLTGYADSWLLKNVFSLYRAKPGTDSQLLLNLTLNYPIVFGVTLPKISYSVADYLNRVASLSATPDWGLEANSACNGEYKLLFNNSNVLQYALLGKYKQGGSEVFSSPAVSSLEKYTSLSDYPVNNEYMEIRNEYIVSPPVDAGTFRIVVKYTDAENADNSAFSVNVFNPGLNGGKVINVYSGYPASTPYITDPNAKYWCPHTDYKNQCPNSSFDGVFLHPFGGLQKTFTQAVTVDTKPGTAGNYAVFVSQNQKMENNAIKPMAGYCGRDLEVLVYKNHNDQFEGSIYAPDAKFSIKSACADQTKKSEDGATTSVFDPEAKYWHAFNIVKNAQGEYAIEPVKEAGDENGDKKADTFEFKNGRIALDIGNGVVDHLPGAQSYGEPLEATKEDWYVAEPTFYKGLADGTMFIVVESKKSLPDFQIPTKPSETLYSSNFDIEQDIFTFDVTKLKDGEIIYPVYVEMKDFESVRKDGTHYTVQQMESLVSYLKAFEDNQEYVRIFLGIIKDGKPVASDKYKIFNIYPSDVPRFEKAMKYEKDHENLKISWVILKTQKNGDNILFDFVDKFYNYQNPNNPSSNIIEEL